MHQASKWAHDAAGTMDNEEKELDGAGVVLAVVVNCKCFVEYDTFFTSYLPASLYLVQLSVTFVTVLVALFTGKKRSC